MRVILMFHCLHVKNKKQISIPVTDNGEAVRKRKCNLVGISYYNTAYFSNQLLS